ncbi:MAG TPA: ElyC/SanA/YdcF family protein [Terriglobia bacterium]|nr:ElyC/SanA/YdcF family protein [Terriglobia bacterium]
MLVKIVSRFFFPVPVICALLLIGLALLWFTRRQKAGKVVLTAGTLMLLALSCGPLSTIFLRTLEQRYPPVAPASLQAAAGKSRGSTCIVVLGSGYSPDPSVDLDSHLSQDGVVRLLKGIQLCRQAASCKLVLSGGPVAAAQTMGKIALSMGIKQQDIILEERSRNTEEEARFVQPTVGASPFLLVTSASHMPRAMGLFRKLGMQPIAAPTDYLAKTGGPFSPDNYYPGTGRLSEAERTVYEYLGMAWEKLLGQI